jgi:hypothetical protein
MRFGPGGRSPLQLLFLAPLVFLPACGDPPELPAPEIVRADSAGVQIVRTRGDDAELPWQFEPLFSLGGDDEGPASFYRVDPSMVGADKAGRLFVLSGSRVEVFDQEGSHLRSLGREGEGPGEIVRGNALAVSAEGEVAVFDVGKGALVRFGPGGEPFPQVRLEVWPVQDGSRRLGPVRGSFLVNHSRTLAGEDAMEVQLLELAPGEDEEGRVLARLVRPAGVMVHFERCGGGLRRPPILAPELVWDARSGRVAWSDGPGFRVEVVGPGEGRLSVRREMPSVPGGPALARAKVAEGLTIRFGGPWAEPCHISPEEMVDGWGYADEMQGVRWLTLGPEGRLWVTRREVRDREITERVDVFAPDGAYLGTLPAGAPSPILALPGNRVAWVEEGTLEIERLVVGRVVQRSEGRE